MTKIGEGDSSYKVPNSQTYHQDVEQSSVKFENALQGYLSASDGEEKSRFKGMMDQQLQLIQKSVQEIKTRGIDKQSEKVKVDYDHFIAEQSDENLAALEHDVQTLRDYNQISTPAPKPGDQEANLPIAGHRETPRKGG